MGFILRIFITGLVALVPGKDGKSLTVLLQVTPGEPSMRHVPIFLYECKNGPCGSYISQPLECALHLSHRPYPFDGVLLAGDEISVSGAMLGELALAHGKSKHHWYHDWIGSRPENSSETPDFSWVPSMSHISRTAGTVAARHLNMPNRCEIAGVMRLANIKGTARVFALTQYEGRVSSLTFKRPGGLKLRGCKQALADTVLVELTVAGPDVTLEVKPFGQVSPRSAIKLMPKMGESRVDVLVGNLFLPCGSDPEELAMHFGMYYNLASRLPNEVLIPSLGMRSVVAGRVEPAAGEVPPILTEWDTCSHRKDLFGGFQKPICTLVSLAAP